MNYETQKSRWYEDKHAIYALDGVIWSFVILGLFLLTGFAK